VPATLRDLLQGGDRRSIARSNRALVRVRADPSLVRVLVDLTGDPDWLVSFRALDLLEKLSHEQPAWVAPHRKLFLGPLADSSNWELRLQVVRALPLFDWTPAEMGARQPGPARRAAVLAVAGGPAAAAHLRALGQQGPGPPGPDHPRAPAPTQGRDRPVTLPPTDSMLSIRSWAA
jgi:hypothetical protein